MARLIYRSLVWAPRVVQQNSLSCQTGTYTLTGVAAGLKVALRMTMATGAYVLTGKAATLFKNITLVAARGTYVLTGVVLILARKAARSLLIRNAAAVLQKLRSTAPTLSE